MLRLQSGPRFLQTTNPGMLCGRGGMHCMHAVQCNMAAPGTRSSSSSSSGEETEEALTRLREAAWDPARQSGAAVLSPPSGVSQKSQVSPAESSIRKKIRDQGQDVNELQTTPEFRAHVAKKLEAILDRSIATLEHPLQTAQKNPKGPETEDDGFRLFSSSVPGDCGSPEPSSAVRRRPRPSSSSEPDSDEEWQKFQEAAVSAADILQHSGLPAVLRGPGQDLACQGDETKGKESKGKKKKKQTVAKAEEEEEDGRGEGAGETARCPLNGACTSEKKAETVKKKKKKRRAEPTTE